MEQEPGGQVARPEPNHPGRDAETQAHGEPRGLIAAGSTWPGNCEGQGYDSVWHYGIEGDLIALSRLGGTVVAINPDLISWIDVTPDTTISILGGDKIIVREPLDEVIKRIIEFRRAVGIGRDSWLSDRVLERAAQHRDPSASQRPSNRPPHLSTVPPPHSERK